ncbi:hypothetical protein Q4544_14960 [Cognatishimia sp. 1_MG-2023]|uniref:hypothetical protein n=1 Tax=Cognatishimia sp. 1_MG-2023 TaxID=3062642 RepID=UPI0026E22AB4|nr:hypothetical protein [Cognatishimia sp. 1_MG-2023]MDO6728238.1 hypothetical protein [Cognatishimia sp. 1_MG-2023]
MTTLERVTNEIVDLHDFFTEWFNGSVNRDQLEPRFLSRLHKDLQFIPPEGFVMSGSALKNGFEQGYGSNPDFRIQIRDVDIRHERDGLVLATYTEWQTGAALSAHANNARVTTVLMEMTSPITWLHLQETWLPEAVRAAGSFDF